MASSAGTVDVDPKEAEVNKLRKLEPHLLRVMLVDGNVRDIARASGRKYWAHMLDTVRKLGEWVQIEALDKEQRVLGLVRNPDIELEEDLSVRVSDGTVAQQVERLLAIMLQGQDVALKRHESLVGKILSALDVMLGVFTDGMKAVGTQYRTALEVQGAAARASKGGGGGDDGDGYKPGDMSEALIFEMLKAELPDLIKQFMGKAKPPKPKPNGKAEKPPIDVDADEKPKS